MLTWTLEGEGHLLIIRTTKSPNLYPPPLSTSLLNLKDLWNHTFVSHNFHPLDMPPFLLEVNRGGGTAAARGQQGRPLQRAQVFSPHSLQNRCRCLGGLVQKPSLDLTKVPLFVGSICIFVIQAHLLFPPPLSRRRSPPPFSFPARLIDHPVYHASKDCCPPDVDLVQDGGHAALL